MNQFVITVARAILCFSLAVTLSTLRAEAQTPYAGVILEIFAIKGDMPIASRADITALVRKNVAARVDGEYHDLAHSEQPELSYSIKGPVSDSSGHVTGMSEHVIYKLRLRGGISGDVKVDGVEGDEKVPISGSATLKPGDSFIVGDAKFDGGRFVTVVTATDNPLLVLPPDKDLTHP